MPEVVVQLWYARAQVKARKDFADPLKLCVGRCLCRREDDLVRMLLKEISHVIAAENMQTSEAIDFVKLDQGSALPAAVCCCSIGDHPYNDDFYLQIWCMTKL